MHNIYEVVMSPVWWVSVVVAGIVINLFSRYLGRGLDTQLSKVSGWWSMRSRARQEAEEKYIARLREEPDFRELNKLRREYQWNLSMVYLIIVLMMLILTEGSERDSWTQMGQGLAIGAVMLLWINASFLAMRYMSCAIKAIKGEDDQTLE